MEAVDKALSFNPSVIVFGGDLLHHPKPDPVSIRAVIKGLLKAARRTNVIVVIGNHEISGHLGTTYAPLYSDIHENIHVLTTDSPKTSIEVSGRKIVFHGFQFLRNRELAEKTLREVAGGLAGGDVNVLCIHQAVEKYLEPHEISLSCLREVASGFDLILLGHVHKHQRINEVFDVCPAYYVGSTERVSFNEWENPTGFMVFNDMEFREPRYVEVSSAGMKKIRIKLSGKTASEVNVFIKSKIEENTHFPLLSLEVAADVSGDMLDVRKNWSEDYPDATILEVNVTTPQDEQDITIERVNLSGDTIREYFEKTGVKDELLQSTCINLFEEYGIP